MTTGAGWTYLGGSPAWILLLGVAAAVSIVSGLISSKGLARKRRVALFSLRLLGLALLAVAVLRPARLEDITRLRTPPLIFLFDRSQSMGHGGVTTGLSLNAWMNSKADRIRELSQFYKVEYLGLGIPPQVIAPSSWDASPPFSDDRTPLRETLEYIARTRKDLSGLVLLSDGQDTQSPDDPPLSLPFPVYSVVGEDTPVKDLKIEGLNTPPVAFVRTPLTVRVRLGTSGYAPGRATVNLFEEGRLIGSESVQLEAEQGECQMSFTPRRTGRWAYTVEVLPWAGETVLENNRAGFSLQVIRDKMRVLLVAGSPSWDVKFLRRRLRQDPGVDLISFFILRTPQDLSLVPQEEMSLIPFPTRELFSEELASFDAVIFANFNYAPYVPVQYLENLVKFVREDGGGFIMLGGDRSFALGGYAGTPLEQILPVELTGYAPGGEFIGGEFRPRLTLAGESHPIMQWKVTSSENLAYWNSLPPSQGMNWILRPKEGSYTLAENPEKRNEYGPLAFIVAGEFGSGRSLAIASDSLWRWALPNAGAGGSSSAYKDFWTRALKWIVHDPDMELVRLSVPPEPVRANQSLRFQARVLDRYYAPASGAKLKGSARWSEGRRSLNLQWNETAPGEYSSSPVALPEEGAWRVEVDARIGNTVLGKDALGFSVEPPSTEVMRLGINRRYLEKVSQTSEGQVVSVPESDAFLDRLVQLGRADREVVGRKLDEVWPVWPLYVLALAVLGMDWGLRRFWQ